MRKIIKALFLLPALLISGCNQGDTVAKEQYDYMRDHLTDMWADSLKDAGYKVAFYGDSRVAGADFKEEFKEYSAVNLGVGGDKVEDLIDRFKLIEACKPEITFVQIGGNNALASDYSVGNFVNKFEELMKKFETVETKVVLHTTPGISNKLDFSDSEISTKNARIKEINQKIEEFSTKYNLDIIDLAPLLNDENGALKNEYTTDGAHFTNEANQIWFNEIESYLSTYYKK